MMGLPLASFGGPVLLLVCGPQASHSEQLFLKSDPFLVCGCPQLCGSPQITLFFEQVVVLACDCPQGPFSPRKGTPAARMPQVKGDIIKKRAEVLRQLAKKQITNYYKKLKDQKVSVIVESKNRGRTDNFAKISIPDNFKNGELLNMIVTGHNDYGLTGKVIV